jgi:hypothetical protein
LALRLARCVRRFVPGVPTVWKLARLAQPRRLCAWGAGALAWLEAPFAEWPALSVAAGAVEAIAQQHTHSASSAAQTAACRRW